MPVVKYDVSDVESGSADAIKAGMYEAAITEASYGKSSNQNNMFTLVLTITKGDYKNRKLWHYILPEQAEFRMREFTDALGLPPKGSVDTTKIIGTVVGVRTVIQKSEEYGEQARVKNLLPAAGGEEDGDDEAPYTEWETSELLEEVTARELTVSGKKTKAALIRTLEADDEASGGGEAEEAEEEEAEEGDDETLTMADLEAMDRTALKKLIKDEELDVKVLKRHTDDEIRALIAEAAGIEADEEEGAEEEEEEAENAEDDAPPYDEWEIADLKAELKERGLKPDGRKSILVVRLTKDDESSGESDPF